MAGRDYTTSGLLAAIRAEGSIPDEDPDATDAKLLLAADRVYDRVFVPAVRKAVSDFYVTSSYLTITAGTAEYRVPHRAVTSSVRAVVVQDTGGREYPLVPLPLADRHNFYPSSQSFPSYYCLADDKIVLLPTPNNSSQTLRIVHEYRAGKLILPADAALISAVAAPVVTDDTALYVVGTSGTFDPTDPTPCDVVDHLAPFSVIGFDGSFDGSVPVIGATLELNTRYQAPVAGNYICPVGETPIPQIPAELHGLLALYTAGWYLMPTDPSTGQNLISQAQASLTDALALLSPRQIGRQMKIKSESSLLRRGARFGGGFGDWRP